MTCSEIYRQIKLKVKCRGMSTERSCQRSRERDGAGLSIGQKRHAKENPEAHFRSSIFCLFRCRFSLFISPFTFCRHHLRFLQPPAPFSLQPAVVPYKCFEVDKL